jgi:broad specificity phosphatase PhoE
MRNARLAIAVFLLLASSLHAAPPSRLTTIILVRHAEKAAPVGDPPLSAAGIARAGELARVLADAGIRAIYTTQFVRTGQTAQPLAALLSLTPIVVPASDSYAADVVSKIMADHKGQTVLVTGHSNTIPLVLARLGIRPVPDIPDSRYDDLFICQLPEEGAATSLHLRYGAPSGAVPAPGVR